MDEKARTFLDWYFAREIQVKPQPMIKQLIMQSSGEGGVGNKQPSDFMEITKMERRWNCRPLQLSYGK